MPSVRPAYFAGQAEHLHEVVKELLRGFLAALEDADLLLQVLEVWLFELVSRPRQELLEGDLVQLLAAQELHVFDVELGLARLAHLLFFEALLVAPFSSVQPTAPLLLFLIDQSLLLLRVELADVEGVVEIVVALPLALLLLEA